MGKIETSLDAICYPKPISIVGAMVNGKPNYLTVAYVSMVNRQPQYIGVGLNKVHYTNAGVKESGTFSVNFPSRAAVEVTDYLGLVSGRKYDKSTKVETFFGKLKTAPMIKECPHNLECRLIQTIDLPGNEFFIGEVVAAYTDEQCLTNGVPDIKKVDPIMLAGPQYLGTGDYVAKAWDVGKKLIDK
jgi:flavin reductase (DIM6/NTAB) family NADH-FMN oxidoreductase RutF